MSSEELLLSPKTSGDRLKKLLQAEEMDPNILATANLYLQKKTVQDIALDLDIREDRVSQILDREEVQIYIRETLLSQGFLNPFRRLELINGVIESLVAQGIQNEKMTDKDLLDWIKEVRSMSAELKPKKAAPAVAVQVNNNYDRLVSEIS
jgi:hypothetical protein